MTIENKRIQLTVAAKIIFHKNILDETNLQISEKKNSHVKHAIAS